MWKSLFAVVLLGLVALSVSMATSNTGRTVYPRPNRGFKNAQLSTARGFGKRDNFLAIPAAIPNVNLEAAFPPDSRASYPNSWLVDEIQGNPDVAKLIVDRFVDENGDGELTADELLKKPYL